MATSGWNANPTEEQLKSLRSEIGHSGNTLGEVVRKAKADWEEWERERAEIDAGFAHRVGMLRLLPGGGAVMAEENEPALPVRRFGAGAGFVDQRGGGRFARRNGGLPAGDGIERQGGRHGAAPGRCIRLTIVHTGTGPSWRAPAGASGRGRFLRRRLVKG